MNNVTVIAYRNRSEANLDWFLQDCLYPWMYTHAWHIIGVILICGAAIHVKDKFFDRNRF
jgi:hypothetical protein